MYTHEIILQLKTVGWHILYLQVNEMVPSKKACQSSVSFSGCVVYVGEQGGVWWGESLGGVCYQGTEPNSWLILELLERKSRGLTFPAVFCSSRKLIWKYTFAVQHVFHFMPSEMPLKVVFTALTYRMLHTQKKGPLISTIKLFQLPISHISSPDII